MRCACGHSQFIARLRRTKLFEQPRWRIVARGSVTGGLGYTPLGTTGGAASVLYGRVDVDINVGALSTCCRACGRLRHERPVGGGAVVGTWRAGETVYLLMSDTIDVTCVRAQFREGTQIRDAEVRIVDQEPAALPEGVEETSTVLPRGAIVGDTVYAIEVPNGLSGEVRLILIDRCLKVQETVGTFVLGD